METNNYIAPGAHVIGNVALGEGASVWHNAVVRADHKKITIGAGSNVQDNATLHIERHNDIEIGTGVTIGHNAIVHGCIIGDDCLIGMGAIVLTGAVIGKNCIIGAGALIPENAVIEDGSVVVGCPGKVRRQVTDDDIKMIKENAAHYVELANEYKEGRYN